MSRKKERATAAADVALGHVAQGATTSAAVETMGTSVDDCRRTHAMALTKLEEAERKAWLSLAGYKFVMFGYWAGQWVLLKTVLPGHRTNPFRDLVNLAKAVVEQRGYKGEDNG